MNGQRSLALVQHLQERHWLTLLSGVHEVFVALETERLCKFVSLVMFVPGEHYKWCSSGTIFLSLLKLN